MIRRTRGKDIDLLRYFCGKYYEDEFDFPDLTHCVDIPISERDGRVIGGGIFRVIPEAIIILDKDSSMRDKVGALKELIGHGEKLTTSLNHEGMHVFVEEGSFEQILKKHFGFRDSVGKVLFKEV